MGYTYLKVVKNLLLGNCVKFLYHCLDFIEAYQTVV